MLEEDQESASDIFLFFFFFFFKSLLFPHKRKRAAHYYPKKSFEANGARGRLDEEGSLNDTAGGLLRLLRRRLFVVVVFFFPRRCFGGFLEGSHVLYNFREITLELLARSNRLKKSQTGISRLLFAFGPWSESRRERTASC